MDVNPTGTVGELVVGDSVGDAVGDVVGTAVVGVSVGLDVVGAALVGEEVGAFPTRQICQPACKANGYFM